MRQLLLSALDQELFEKNELIYLALGSKVERQVVDRLAWDLRKTRQITTAREWRRTDLAFFPLEQREPERPIGLLEAKAFSSFAIEKQADKYPALIREDLKKAMGVVTSPPSEPEIFILVLMTHLKEKAPRELEDLVKYPFWFREPVKLHAAEDKVKSLLERLGPFDCVTLQRGEAWGVPALVEAWLCGPVDRSAASEMIRSFDQRET